MPAAGIDVGGIEYMIDDRDGQLVYYDINALSNFVADAPNVVGFDPFARLVDYPRSTEARGVTMRLRLLAAGVRRLAAQRRRREHGADVGVRQAGWPGAASRSASTSRSSPS